MPVDGESTPPAAKAHLGLERRHVGRIERAQPLVVARHTARLRLLSERVEHGSCEAWVATTSACRRAREAHRAPRKTVEPPPAVDARARGRQAILADGWVPAWMAPLLRDDTPLPTCGSASSTRHLAPARRERTRAREADDAGAGDDGLDAGGGRGRHREEGREPQ